MRSNSPGSLRVNFIWQSIFWTGNILFRCILLLMRLLRIYLRFNVTKPYLNSRAKISTIVMSTSPFNSMTGHRRLFRRLLFHFSIMVTRLLVFWSTSWDVQDILLNCWSPKTKSDFWMANEYDSNKEWRYMKVESKKVPLLHTSDCHSYPYTEKLVHMHHVPNTWWQHIDLQMCSLWASLVLGFWSPWDEIKVNIEW